MTTRFAGLASMLGIALGMASALAIGADSPDATTAIGPRCTLAKFEEWPVRVVRNHVIVDGAINGQKVGVMLDTGAMRSLILRSAAIRLELPRKASNYRMFGVGGETSVEVAFVEDFRIGPASRKGWRLLTAGEQDFGDGTSVLLGDDFFHSVDVEFDLAHHAVRLFRAKDCDGVSLAYWTTDAPGVVEIEAVHEAQPQILLTVRINDTPVEALLDSGASASILARRDAAAAGLTPATPGVVAVGKGIGIGAREVDTWVGPIRTFTIGNETIRDTAIFFGDLWRGATYTDFGSHLQRKADSGQPMLLGTDFLLAHRVLVAHSQRKLYFTYVGGPVFRAAGAR